MGIISDIKEIYKEGQKGDKNAQYFFGQLIFIAGGVILLIVFAIIAVLSK